MRKRIKDVVKKRWSDRFYNCRERSIARRFQSSFRTGGLSNWRIHRQSALSTFLPSFLSSLLTCFLPCFLPSLLTCFLHVFLTLPPLTTHLLQRPPLLSTLKPLTDRTRRMSRPRQKKIKSKRNRSWKTKKSTKEKKKCWGRGKQVNA